MSAPRCQRCRTDVTQLPQTFDGGLCPPCEREVYGPTVATDGGVQDE